MSRRKVFALLTVGVMMTTLVSAQTEEEIEDAIRVFHRGKTLHQEKRYEEAIREYRAALKLDRENPFLYNAIGLALAAIGNFQESLQAFKVAIQLNPDLTDVYNNMGMVYTETEREKRPSKPMAARCETRTTRHPKKLCTTWAISIWKTRTWSSHSLFSSAR